MYLLPEALPGGRPCVHVMQLWSGECGQEQEVTIAGTDNHVHRRMHSQLNITITRWQLESLDSFQQPSPTHKVGLQSTSRPAGVQPRACPTCAQLSASLRKCAPLLS